MYIEDGEDGRTKEKNEEVFSREIATLLNDKTECQRLGDNARKKYLAHFSRFQLGKQNTAIFEKIEFEINSKYLK